MKQLKQRKPLRLKDFDYSSAGAYFVTVCTHNRECLFDGIIGEQMRLNELGQMVLDTWNELPNRFSGIQLDEFLVMPNHVHGIIHIVGAGFPRPKTNGTVTRCMGVETAPLRKFSLGQIAAYFKYQSTKRINITRETPGLPIWQRNYYEHVIRNENELFETRQYIQQNPLKWALDPEYAI